MIPEHALRNLNNFLSSYTLAESTKLLSQVYDHVIKGTSHIVLDEKRKEQILDFLEALEELNCAVNDLYRNYSENVV